MKWQCDVLVIGTGTAASQVIRECTKAGRDVIVVDERAYGGTCARRGCQAKKFLVAAAEVAALGAQLQGRGLAGPASLVWSDLLSRKREFTEAVPAKVRAGYEKTGARNLHATASFLDAHRVALKGADSGVVQADSIVVATGAAPVALDIAGAELLTTSEEFLELESLPRRMVCVGGGFVSLEFAHVASRAGVEVTILQRGPRLLTGFDPDLVETLAAASRERGMEICTDTPVVKLEKDQEEIVVHAEDGRTWRTDLVLHGAGRAPALERLNLEAAGVQADGQGITVDADQRSTTNPAVYAIGDAAAGALKLAPTADHQGMTAAAHILGRGSYPQIPPRQVPSIAFTWPPVARVGWGEEEARQAGLEIEVRQGDTSSWSSGRVFHETHGGFKLISDRHDGRLLGAHVLGKGAGEVVNIFALAMGQSLRLEDLRTMVWAYPTLTSEIKSMVISDPQ